MLAAVQLKQLDGLRKTNAALGKKLAEKVQLSIDEQANRIFKAVTDRIEGEVQRRVEIHVKEIELRFRREAAYEEAQMKRIGELVRNIDALERRVADLTQRAR